MTREELIEKMARELDGKLLFEPTYTNVRFAKRVAEVALTALESALPGLSDVVEGRAVIVPREPTRDMLRAMCKRRGIDADSVPTDALGHLEVNTLAASVADYRAMLSAAPTKE